MVQTALTWGSSFHLRNGLWGHFPGLSQSPQEIMGIRETLQRKTVQYLGKRR